MTVDEGVIDTITYNLNLVVFPAMFTILGSYGYNCNIETEKTCLGKIQGLPVSQSFWKIRILRILFMTLR